MSLVSKFQQQIIAAETGLRRITEEQAEQPYHHGSWSRKQLLGHLIDSAANNHIRFVRASLQDAYEGPTYDQDDWVRRHRYETVPWSDLVNWWSTLNSLIVHVVKETPVEKYAVPCFVGEFPVMTLQALMEDYLVHMNHHLTQLWPA